MLIDLDKLRNDMLDNCMAAWFGAGIDVAVIDAVDIERASAEALVALALQQKIDLCKYEIP